MADLLKALRNYDENGPPVPPWNSGGAMMKAAADEIEQLRKQARQIERERNYLLDMLHDLGHAVDIAAVSRATRAEPTKGANQ